MHSVVLFVEFVLFLVAFLRGWRWKALWPVVFFVGIGIAATVLLRVQDLGYVPSGYKMFMLLLDIGLCMVLAIMSLIRYTPTPKQ